MEPGDQTTQGKYDISVLSVYTLVNFKPDSSILVRHIYSISRPFQNLPSFFIQKNTKATPKRLSDTREGIHEVPDRKLAYNFPVSLSTKIRERPIAALTRV